jgi:WD40 repeat protein
VLKSHTKLVRSVAFSPGGKQIVSALNNKSVWVWDASTCDQLEVLKGHTDSVRSVAFSPDGKQIVSDSDDNSVWVWDFGSLYIHEMIPNSNHHEKSTGWLLFPDGHRLMFVSPELLLPDASNILTIPHSSCSLVDFAHSALGPQQEQCYHP